MNISVHAGHNPDGKVACGAIGYMRESTEARKVCSILVSMLEGVCNVRNDTVDNGISQKDVLVKLVNKINSQYTDIAISIHLNSFKHSLANGTEVFLYSSNGSLLGLARNVINNITKRCGYQNRGVKSNPNLYILKNTKCPAMLIECAFVTSKDDTEKWDPYVVAGSIYDAIMKYFDLKKPSNPIPDEELPTDIYRVQVGAFRDKNNAKRLRDELTEKGYDTIITQA